MSETPERREGKAMKLPPKPLWYNNPDAADWVEWGRACAEAMREACEKECSKQENRPVFATPASCRTAIRNIKIEED